MLFRIHFFPWLCILTAGLALEYGVAKRLRETASRRLLWWGGVALTALMLAGYALEFESAQRSLPALWATWLQCAALFEVLALAVAFGALHFSRTVPRFEPQRRALLGATACLVPGVTTAFGILHRNQFRLTEVRIPIDGLPKDLNGLRLVQISDVHLSPFLSEREFSRGIDMANETRAHLALMTGDLISRRGDPLDACLRQLGRLRADAGAIGCLGNHEVYAQTEEYVTEEGRRRGIDFLRNQAKTFQFGDASIRFAGVDYQRFEKPYLAGAERLIQPGAVNVLLSHNPDVFPVAAAKGYGLTIAGHTHGGQVDFEILHQHLNIARVYTPYTRGLYRHGNSSLYVSTGLGTIGMPLRLGAPPEVSLIVLCAT